MKKILFACLAVLLVSCRNTDSKIKYSGTVKRTIYLTKEFGVYKPPFDWQRY